MGGVGGTEITASDNCKYPYSACNSKYSAGYVRLTSRSRPTSCRSSAVAALSCAASASYQPSHTTDSDTNVQYRHTNTVYVLYICVLVSLIVGPKKTRMQRPQLMRMCGESGDLGAEHPAVCLDHGADRRWVRCAPSKLSVYP